MAQGQKPFYLALGAIALAGIAFLALRVFGGGTVSIPANVVVTTADTTGFRGYVMGAAAAPIEITEYADYQCPGCAQFTTVEFTDVKARLVDAGKARFRFRDFPLDGAHTHGRVGAHAAACANDQGKFWEMEETIFQRQNDWAPKSDAMGIFKEIGRAIGLDMGSWQSCMESAKYAGRIQASKDEGEALGVGSTPSFLIGGRLYAGLSSDQMVALVDSLIAARAGTPAK